MKKYILLIISISLFISSCSSTSTSNQDQLKQEIAKQQSYYAGYWRSCMENFTTYSNDNLDKITKYCKDRLKQAVDNDYYNGEQKGNFVKFVSTEKDFANIYEYEFYRGGWNECFIDVVTMSDLKDQQLLDFCSNVLVDAKAKDWSNKKNATFSDQPIIILATPEPQG